MFVARIRKNDDVRKMMMLFVTRRGGQKVTTILFVDVNDDNFGLSQLPNAIMDKKAEKSQVNGHICKA